jgi:hypothetical protein
MLKRHELEVSYRWKGDGIVRKQTFWGDESDMFPKGNELAIEFARALEASEDFTDITLKEWKTHLEEVQHR